MKSERKIQFNVRDIYIYLIKLILFITIIIFGTSFINSLVDYFIPTDYIDSFDSYKNSYIFDSTIELSDSEINSMYDDYVDREKSIQSNYKLNDLISSFVILLFCGICLFYLRNKSLVINETVLIEDLVEKDKN